MKKNLALLLALVMLFALAACGRTAAPAASQPEAENMEPASAAVKIGAETVSPSTTG